jgi:nucleotidyltransferase/DNA polymerase involved in DNA repair
MSQDLFNLLQTYTTDIEIVSVDECFLDYGKVKNIYGDELEFAKKLKDKIYKTFGFTVNIGIANNKLCAKMASDFSKPNKIHTLYDYEIKTKMWPLPIDDLYGIGKKSAVFSITDESFCKAICDSQPYSSCCWIVSLIVVVVSSALLKKKHCFVSFGISKNIYL